MLWKRAFQPHEKRQLQKRFLSNWKWLTPPVLAMFTAITIWWGMPKPAIPSIYENAKLAVSNQTSTSSIVHSPSQHSSVSTPGSSSHTTPPAPPISVMPALPTRQTLVALGDSITFGFNLPGAATNHPSPDAFPSLVGQHNHDQVVNLGVPGATSSDLLAALQTPTYQTALHKATIVTVDIGSNDLLSTSYDLLTATQSDLPPKNDVLSDSRYKQAVQQFANNLPKIVDAIHQQTSAPIVLLNLYDPFPDGSAIHDIGEQLIAAANQVIWQVAAQSGIPVVDAYSTINHHQSTLIRLNELDIHPTIAGQQALAAGVEQVLTHPLQAQPTAYALAKQGILVRSKPQLGPNAIHWLESGSGVLITGYQGDWLQVVTPAGQSGFVQSKYVTLVVRPWSDVSFQGYTEHLPTGTMTDAVSRRTTDVFLWNGTVYAPIQYLADLAQASVQINTDTEQVDVQTPNHSGLIQSGLLPEASSSQSTPPSPEVSVQLSSMRPYSYVQFSTVGLMVTMDGEPVNLVGQAVLHGGQVEVPVESFWQALGGTVTHNTSGLPMLSVSGS